MKWNAKVQNDFEIDIFYNIFLYINNDFYVLTVKISYITLISHYKFTLKNRWFSLPPVFYSVLGYKKVGNL